MHDPILDPIQGKSVLAWAVPVTRALNSLGDRAGATARNERDRRGSGGGSGGPFPWQVRWDPSLAGGEGNWKIYLPANYGSSSAAGGYCLSFKDVYIQHGAIHGLAWLGGPWFSVNLVAGRTPAWLTGALWLHLVVWDPPNDVEAYIADFKYNDSSTSEVYKREVGGEDVYPMYVINVCIAEVSLATSNETTTGTVDAQCVVGALHIGSRVTYE